MRLIFPALLYLVQINIALNLHIKPFRNVLFGVCVATNWLVSVLPVESTEILVE